jgi:hypothetical protein
MRSITLFTLVLGFLNSSNSNAQTGIKAAAEKWSPHNCQATFDKDIIHVTNTSGKTALLWLNNMDLKNGIVELDIKGEEAGGQSFLGIVFHAADNDHYDAIYFRPFAFMSPEKKEHAVQYINIPDNDWDVLREKHPGKYENNIHPAPDPNDWFHVKIIISYPAIKVYVNGAQKPTLEVEQISKRTNGKFGLWLDSENGWFKNVVISQTD